MNFRIAEKIVRNMSSCDVHLNNIAEIIEDIEDVEERRRMRQTWGQVVGAMYDVLRPIEIEHPSLKI